MSSQTITSLPSRWLGWAAVAAVFWSFSALVLSHPGAAPAFPAVVLGCLLAMNHRRALAWPTLIAAVITVVLFVPIRRFDLSVGLPVKFEPYRILVALVLIGWIAALLFDPRVRLRSSVLDLPMLALVFASAASIVANADRIYAGDLGGYAVKQLLLLISFALVFLFIISTVRTYDTIESLLQVIVLGGAVLGVLAVVEYWTDVNVFSRLPDIVPALKPTEGLSSLELQRMGRLRVYGSAQHPIAFGALLIMLLPLSLYFARGRRWWYLTVLSIGLGSAATLSRTAVLMGLTALSIIALLKWHDTKRAVRMTWVYLIPVVIVMHLALPGALGSFKELFFPSQGLIAEQSEGFVGSSRGASFGPGLKVVKEHAVLGVGYGTRVVQGAERNSFIVDDQWLSTAMETGLIGVAAVAWFFGRALWVFGRAARRDQTRRGWLLAMISASVAAYAAGMITYDSMSFIQVTFIMFVVAALGCCTLLSHERPANPSHEL